MTRPDENTTFALDEDPVAGPMAPVRYQQVRLEREDRVRRWLAYWVLGIFSGYLLFAPVVLFALFLKPGEVSDVKDLYFAIFTAMIGVVGGVLGYYYGKDKER